MSGLNVHARVISQPTPPFHDQRIPRPADSEAFRRFMGTDWQETETTAEVPPGVAESARLHRNLLSERWPGHTLVIAGGSPIVRNADQHFPFRADSDFVWLTGCTEPGATLVMRPVANGHESVLFLPSPWRPSDPGFYLDVVTGPMWVGPRASLDSWAELLALDVLPSDQLDRFVESLTRVRFAGDVDQVRQWGGGVSDMVRESLATLRLIKDPWEVNQLRNAAVHTRAGFGAVARELPNAVAGGGERWLQGTFDRHARTLGNGPGYQSIVGSGSHAPVLHWTKATGRVSEGDLVLLDLGVEERTLYTADVTRTVPVSGRFTAAQRAVYDVVHAAHVAALAECRPGRPFASFSHAAMEVLVDGLRDLGLINVPADVALSPEGQQHRRYIVCGVGHHLGLDVHDCAHADYADYQAADLEPGMVFTVEPGLYFHASDLTVPKELRGLGVRIEDDVVITDRGMNVLSNDLPIDAEAVEQWVLGHLDNAAERPVDLQ